MPQILCQADKFLTRHKPTIKSLLNLLLVEKEPEQKKERVHDGGVQD